MLRKTSSSVLKRIKGSFLRAYSIKSTDIEFADVSILPFKLNISDTIALKLRILWSHSILITTNKTLDFHSWNTRIYGDILAKNIHGLVFHRKCYLEDEERAFKETVETFIFKDHLEEIVVKSAAIQYIYKDPILKPMSFDKFPKEQMAHEKIEMSLIYNRNLPEDLEMFQKKKGERPNDRYGYANTNI